MRYPAVTHAHETVQGGMAQQSGILDANAGGKSLGMDVPFWVLVVIVIVGYPLLRGAWVARSRSVGTPKGATPREWIVDAFRRRTSSTQAQMLALRSRREGWAPGQGQ